VVFADRIKADKYKYNDLENISPEGKYLFMTDHHLMKITIFI
jgi:hypothetical protein